jgi:hypothetical protein
MVSKIFTVIFDGYHILLISIGCAKTYVERKGYLTILNHWNFSEEWGGGERG